MKMADTRFVEITLEEMEAFLKRAFRALRPKKNQGRGGEVTFDLSLSDNHSILVRVYTSIYAGSGLGRSKGSDSIKVVMLTDKGKPLMPAGKIVKRMKNWRTSLQDRIEEYLETYEAKVEYWKNRRLERNEGKAPVRENALDEAIQKSLPPPSPTELREREEEDPEEREVREELENSVEKSTEPPAPATQPSNEPFEGEYKSIPGGGFGIVIWTKGRPGQEGIGKTKGGKRTKIRLVEKKKDFKDPYHNNAAAELWSFEDINPGNRGQHRRWAEDSMVDSVVDRYLNRAV